MDTHPLPWCCSSPAACVHTGPPAARRLPPHCRRAGAQKSQCSLPARKNSTSVSQCVCLTLLATEQNGVPLQRSPAPSNKKQPLTNPGKSANKPICKKSMRQRQPASSVKVGQKALRKQRQDISQHFHLVGWVKLMCGCVARALQQGKRVYTTLAGNKEGIKGGKLFKKNYFRPIGWPL